MYNKRVHSSMFFAVSAVSLALPLRAFAQKNDNLETQYGDIRITKARRIQGKGDFSGVRLLGPQTLITVPYPRSHSQLVIHADDITTKAENGDQFAHATLVGNVRYTMTQNVGGGVSRTVTGTAERAVFNHKSQRIEMDGAVHVTLADPERLAAPGEIHAVHAIVEMDKSPYLYTLTGSSDSNSIAFTPKEDASKLGEKQKNGGIGSVHVSGYDKGVFQIGQSAHFEGDGTTVEINGKENQSQAQIRAVTFDADFTEKRSALKTAIANGHTRYHITRPQPNSDGKQADDVSGLCDSIEYDSAAAKFTLVGNVNADILAPGTLQGPAKVRVERLIAHTATPFSYEMKSASRNALIAFTPIAPVAKPVINGEKPKKPGFALGNVKISRFDYGLYEPGKALHLTVALGKVLFESDDTTTQTRSRILARDVTADFAPDNTIASAKATGNVEFRVAQDAPKTKIAQVIEGTAPEVTYVSDVDTRRLTMPGPFHAAVADPAHLVKPGNLTGAAGDKLTLTLTGTTYDYDIQSDNETATADLIPIPREKKPDVSPAPTKKPAGKGRTKVSTGAASGG